MPEADLHEQLLSWGLPRLRDLPWRNTRDPWAVLVSEVMLQQTQAARVIPKWLAFLEEFPDPATCSAAALGDVLRLWQGLGYPRRARNLHASASVITNDLRGRFPDTLAGLGALPGVGPYTSRAVMAFAFEGDAAVVDTNVARILARVAGRRLTAREAQSRADDWLPRGEAWAWNQVLLDLGATVCGPGAPSCDRCPVMSNCSWKGGPGTDPSIGSAGVSTSQSRFEGSDRQARGRLLRVLVEGSISAAEIPAAAGLVDQGERAVRLAETLVADGLAATDADGRLRLP